jgi:transcriptional regulator with XRE-family HTH domain
MEKLDFGKKLIDVRKAKGLTQEEVAEKCKITVRTIQRVESGLVQPRAYTIKTISDVLGFDFFETSDTGYVVNEVNQNPIFEKRNPLWY